MVLKLKMSQVTDVAEKEIQEPMADKVTMPEPQLGLLFLLSVVHI